MGLRFVCVEVICGLAKIKPLWCAVLMGGVRGIVNATLSRIFAKSSLKALSCGASTTHFH